MNIDTLQEVVLASAAILGALGVIWLSVKRSGRRIASLFKKVGAALDTLNGREEILHPDTGEVLVEETPGLGVRLAHMEEAIVHLSDTQDAVAALTRRVDELASMFSNHYAKSLENESARSEEAKAMWQAIEAISKTPPPDETLGGV